MRQHRLRPPPFWRTGYFDAAMKRPDRQGIDVDDVKRGLERPTFRSVQPDGRRRHWIWLDGQQRWLRVIVEPDGETVHNAFFDRSFRP